jgi:hypothetical protein
LSSTAAGVALEGRAGEAHAIPPAARTISALAIGILPVALAQSMLVPAIPEMARELNVSTADAGWAIAAFFVVASAARSSGVSATCSGSGGWP